MTVNMSRSGVLIERSESGVTTNGSGDPNGSAIEAGDFVRIDIELPAVDKVRPRCLSCIGNVSRVDEANGREYLAVTIQGMQFRDAELSDVPEQQSTTLVM
jgi:hypothetical protein